jgi:hypothetical protein
MLIFELSQGIHKYSSRRFTRKQAAGASKNSPLFELAGVLVRLDHIASFIVNANHGVM